MSHKKIPVGNQFLVILENDRFFKMGGISEKLYFVLHSTKLFIIIDYNVFQLKSFLLENRTRFTHQSVSFFLDLFYFKILTINLLIFNSVLEFNSITNVSVDFTIKTWH